MRVRIVVNPGEEGEQTWEDDLHSVYAGELGLFEALMDSLEGQSSQVSGKRERRNMAHGIMVLCSYGFDIFLHEYGKARVKSMTNEIRTLAAG